MNDPIQRLRDLMERANDARAKATAEKNNGKTWDYDKFKSVDKLDSVANAHDEVFIGQLRNLAPELMEVVEEARILLKNQMEYGEVNWSGLYKSLAALDGKGKQ